MLQVLLPSENVQKIVECVADLIITSEVFVHDFKESMPIQIIDNKLQVNEKLLEKDRIYSIKHKDQEYFIRRHNNTTEIFQLND